MKEITMVTTCEITCISVVTDEEANFMLTHRDDVESKLPDFIKSDVVADDVNVLKNQIFVRDIQN